MTFTRRTLVATLAAFAAAAPFAVAAQAGYPNKPIKVIVPFPAGSTTDIIARAIADKMGQSMGQTLVVENRAGASGTIGQAAVATAAPDGYTIMVHSSSHTVSPHTFAKLPFDTLADFVPVTPISSTPNVLVISPSKNIKTLQELLAYGRANPGKLNFASAGQGSATHLNAEKFKLAAKIDAQNIPFKGSAEAVTEVMAGRVGWPSARRAAPPPCPRCRPPPKRACPAPSSTSGSECSRPRARRPPSSTACRTRW
ncbi:MAG: tctC [Ramlibacter sp.]|nr:tctC [Ramlibacter sp.]